MCLWWILLVFVCQRKSLFILNFFEGQFCWIQNSRSVGFSPNTLNISLHSLPVCMVSDMKSIVVHILLLFSKVLTIFFEDFLFFFSAVFNMMCLGIVFLVFTLIDFLRAFSRSVVWCSSLIWKVLDLGYYYWKYCFCFILSFPFGIPMMHKVCHLKFLSILGLSVHVFLHSFIFLFSFQYGKLHSSIFKFSDSFISNGHVIYWWDYWWHYSFLLLCFW